MDLYMISVIVFFVALAAIIIFDRKKIEWKYYVLFMRRTKRFGDIINSIAQFWPKVWKAFYTIGIIIGILATIYGLYMVGFASYKIATGEITESAVKLILPSISAEETVGEYSVNIPFWTWILVVALILIPHELSHGIAARAEKVRLKSVGLMLLAFFPGAFVEPDDAQLDKKPLMTRLRVFCAGTFANFIIAFLALTILAVFIFPVLFQQGIMLTGIDEGSPAELTGLQNNTIITHVNDIPITITYTELFQVSGFLYDEIGEIEPGKIIKFTDSTGKNYDVTLGKKDSRPYLGILYVPMPSEDRTYSALADLLTKLWLFSFAVGIFNMLPIGPLDGGLVFKSITDKKIKNPKKLQKFVTIAVFLLVLFMFFGASIVGAIS